MGGNFWDGRATGLKLGSPTAEQAQEPPVNPIEMDLPDLACVVYRVTKPENRQQYRVSYQDVWGNGVSNINWPVDIDPLCSQEAAATAITTEPERFNDAIVPLSITDRTKVRAAYDNIALSVAAYEGSKEDLTIMSGFTLVIS